MRRRQAFKRALIPDVRYNNELVARLINTIMLKGKKSVAQEIVYGAFDILKQKRSDIEPLDLFLAALENAKPRLEVKSRRVGGATYQVPLEVPAARQVALAMRWIVNSFISATSLRPVTRLSHDFQEPHTGRRRAGCRRHRTSSRTERHRR